MKNKILKMLCLGAALGMAGCEERHPEDVPPPAPASPEVWKNVSHDPLVEAAAQETAPRALPPGMTVKEEDLPPGTTVDVPPTFFVGPGYMGNPFFYDTPFEGPVCPL